MDDTAVLTEQIFVKVNGQVIATKYMDQLLSAEVDDCLYLPDMFTLRFDDPDVAMLTSEVFKPGDEVELVFEIAEAKTTLLKGEVTAIEPTLNGYTSKLVVRGYSRA